jgi:hypothetical protein
VSAVFTGRDLEKIHFNAINMQSLPGRAFAGVVTINIRTTSTTDEELQNATDS